MSSKPSVTEALTAFRHVRVCEMALHAARAQLDRIVGQLSDAETHQYLEAAAAERQRDSNASQKQAHRT